MTPLKFIGLPSDVVHALQAGGPDANGQPAEFHVSDGHGNPCRHCLSEIPEGAPFLILAHRPFPKPQPYAEVGPIFLHAEACRRHDPNAGVPVMFLGWKQLLIRGYGHDDRIVYGTGQIMEVGALESAAQALLARPEIDYLHLRSASNNCYQCRIERA